MTALRDRLAAPVVIVYWLTLVVGLALYTAIRFDEYWVVVPIWIGAIGGTALGQVLALRDYRLWLTASILGGVALWGVMLSPKGLDTTTFWMAFVPATLCGSLSLADRWSLAAFWFPVVVWMLSILDGRPGRVALDGSGVVLIAGLAIAFIAFLHTRESRRIGLWRAVAAAPLASGHRAAVMKEMPGRQLARAGWTMTVSALAFAFTAWVAPYLWQDESKQHEIAVVGTGTGEGGIPCCPVGKAEIKRTRVKEYFDLGRGRDDRPPPPPECVVCAPVGDVAYGEGELPALPLGGGGAAGSLDNAPYPPSSDGSTPSARPMLPVESVPDPQSSAPIEIPIDPDVNDMPIAPPPSPPTTNEPPSTLEPLPPTVTPPAREPPVRPEPIAATAPAIGSPAPVIEPQRPAPVDGSPLLRWLVILVAGALAYQAVSLALRPLRRMIALRHLRRPFWTETIDQRISNFWQLVLVGLRDAGWRTGSTEPPCEFARRVGIDGVDRCATILERTRHGVGIAADDLATMESSADTAYHAGRRHLGPLARALAWLRWPLA